MDPSVLVDNSFSRPVTSNFVCFQDSSNLSDENWPALSEVTEATSPTVTKPKAPMKPAPSPSLTTNNNNLTQANNNNQSNSDSGGDDSSKENKENTSSNDEGQRTPKRKGKTDVLGRFES